MQICMNCISWLMLVSNVFKSEHFDKAKVIGVPGNVSNIKLSSFLVIRPEKMSYHINLLNSYYNIQ